MDVNLKVLDAVTGSPVAGAVIVRLYPNGGKYSADLLTDNNGTRIVPIPDNSYSLVISANGYHDKNVSLAGAVNHDMVNLRLVPLDIIKSDSVPVNGSDSTILIIGALAVAGYVFRKQIAKIFS